MRSPSFWYSETLRDRISGRLLAPLGMIYAQVTKRRVAREGWRAPVPVVCIGNINAGGTGKTPTILALIAELERQGAQGIHVISRGHGGKLSGPCRVVPQNHTATDVGDEPLLIARAAPVWIGADRAASARAAINAGAQLILMDDGHQNPHLIKDLTLITVDAAQGFGNGHCLPAGPLREPVSLGLARADAVLSIGTPQAQAQFATKWGAVIRPYAHMTAEIRATVQNPTEWQGKRAFAFAGIGNPEKFFTTLRDLGVELTGTLALGDHQPVSQTVWAKMRARGEPILTTEKDLMRLPPPWRNEVEALPIALNFTHPKGAEALTWAGFAGRIMALETAMRTSRT